MVGGAGNSGFAGWKWQLGCDIGYGDSVCFLFNSL